jgi:hypothetical protein
MNQAEFELKYAQPAITQEYSEAIIEEFDGWLMGWALGVFSRLDVYLRGKYYDSKQLRLQTLKDHLRVIGGDRLVASIFIAVTRANEDCSLQQAVGYLAESLPFEDKWDSVRTASELIALGTNGTEASLFTIGRNDLNKPIITVHFWKLIRNSFSEYLDRIQDTEVLPPMIETPLVVTDNRSCGYHSVQEPLILGKYTDHALPLDYAAINTLNKIEWVLDEEVLNEPEVSPGDLDTVDKIRNATQLKNESREIYSILKDTSFHLPWRYDSRGRIYSSGYHVNLQSYEYKKALLNFKKEEYLT